MGNAPALDRIGEGLDHRILANQLGEGLRTVFARENAIGRGCGGLRHLGQVEAEARRFGFVHQLWFRDSSSPLREAQATRQSSEFRFTQRHEGTKEMRRSLRVLGAFV